MNRPQESRLGKKNTREKLTTDIHRAMYQVLNVLLCESARGSSQNPGNQELKNFLGNSYSLVFVEVLVVR